MKSAKNKKISYGKIEAPEGFDDPKNHKVRIAIWMDGDLFVALKKRAEKIGMDYRILAHNLLRESNEKEFRKRKSRAT
ncbi:hypothetical protein K2X05_00685 [bacterium]|nr:hypothetical protein [bacterium]